MAKTALTGSRIRERRQALKIKQAALAEAVGISASYLNLIEHNRRRIGGKVLIAISQALDVDVATLTEGAEEALLTGLREAAAGARDVVPEVDRLEEFVARFPGWAALIDQLRRRAVDQARSIEALNDRLTHDPFLSDAMHELVSNVTAISSTASILVQTPEIEPAWRDRFYRNLNEESQRLSEGSQALMSYFDTQVRADQVYATPLDALESLLGEAGYHLPDLETGGLEAAEALVDEAPMLATPQARRLALSHMQSYIADAERLPLEEIVAAEAEEQDPARLAARFGVPLEQIMRRLASLPAGATTQPYGLVVVDGAGALLMRKPLDGFPIPRFGAACALWPVFAALARPSDPLRSLLETTSGQRFLAYSVAVPVSGVSFEEPTAFRSFMLVSPQRAETADRAVQIGMGCRTCAREGCASRREPSILEPT